LSLIEIYLDALAWPGRRVLKISNTELGHVLWIFYNYWSKMTFIE